MRIVLCFIISFYSPFFCFNLLGQENDKLLKIEKLINNEEYFKSINLLNDFLKNDTVNSMAYAKRGKCYRIIGELDKALIDLKKAVFLDSNSAYAYTSIGVLYTMKGEYRVSINFYNKALKIDSTFSSAYNSRGSTYYYYLNQNDSALHDFTKAIYFDPNLYKPYYNRAIIYRLMNLYDKAILDLTVSLKLKPKTHLTFNERATLYMTKRDYKIAINDFKKAVKYNNKSDVFEKLDNGLLYYNIAYCYQELDNDKKATKYFKISRELGYINK